MSGPSKIEWTDATWNPVTGCSKVSPGCAHCYAEGIAQRFAGRAGNPSFRPWTPQNAAHNVVLHPERIAAPLRWRKPRMVFVNSMSDLFHEQVPDGFIARVWHTMGLAGQHTFQVLTKRPERAREWITRWADLDLYAEVKMVRGPEATRSAHPDGRGQLFADMLESMGSPPDGCAYPTFDWCEGPRWWPVVMPHVWIGTSVENQRHVDRIDHLRETPAAVRFLSCEPLLGPLDLDLAGIGWVIVGGESGPGSRPMHPDWVRSIRDQCQRAGVAFFFKQWGSWHDGSLPGKPTHAVASDGRHADMSDRAAMQHILNDLGARSHFAAMTRTSKAAAGRDLDGRTWDQMPGAGAIAV